MTRTEAGPSRGRRRSRVGALTAVLVVSALVAGCSDRESSSNTASDAPSAASSKHSSSSGGSGSSASSGSTDSSGSNGSSMSPKELAAAKAASTKPSGSAGVAAPNDDDGTRNLASVDPSSGPLAQDASGSVAADPMVSPTPTFPDPGRPDTEGLLPLDGCDALATPFYRAVSSLNVNSTPATVLRGVEDFTAVAARAQAPIADAVQTLLTTAQAAAADAARAQDFAGDTYQRAVKAVHVYLGDACGR